MSTARSTGYSRNAKFVPAPRATVYRAFLDPVALAAWLAPDDMTGTVHRMDARIGGGYRMSLFYAADADGSRGKTADREDRFVARFVELSPPSRIVQAITFDSDDPSIAGEMSMVVTLETSGDGTEVVIEFHDIPPGIRPADNEAGTRMSLEKLARYLADGGMGSDRAEG